MDPIKHLGVGRVKALPETADTSSMSPKFVVSHLDQQMGPFFEAELKEKWAKGDLLPIDYVYDEAKQDWMLLAERFPWASGKSEATVPPPVKEFPAKKKRPPESPNFFAGAKVQLVNGQGEIDISNLQPGEVELVLEDSSIQMQNPLKIQVRAAEPSRVEWEVVEQQTVGHDAEIHLRVFDQSENICTQYADEFLIRAVSSESSQDFHAEVHAGEAVIKVQNTKAGTWTLSLIYSGKFNLQMPAEKSLDWQPGPATHLVVDGPHEYVAGHPVKIQVKAVDSYGNLAKNFQGTVTLEVKAS